MTPGLDASYALAIALEEVDPPNAAVMMEMIAAEGAVAPLVWRFEVANGLLIAVRRQRIPAALPASILANLALLPIKLDEAGSERAWNTTYALAERHGLTIYDAAYLELALRLGSPLASFDSDLNHAARADGVEILGE